MSLTPEHEQVTRTAEEEAVLKAYERRCKTRELAQKKYEERINEQVERVIRDIEASKVRKEGEGAGTAERLEELAASYELLKGRIEALEAKEAARAAGRTETGGYGDRTGDSPFRSPGSVSSSEQTSLERSADSKG